MIPLWITPLVSEALSSLDLSLNTHPVPEIEKLLGQTVLIQGKKLRPLLCFLMGEYLKTPISLLQPYARAAEFVHAATLAHDDVLDESLVRRNRPTLNALASNARAVLAGDLLLARVMAELSALGRNEINFELAKTVEALVQGEWLQLEARQKSAVDRNHLEKVARYKTASLMIWCCTTPARLKNASSEIVSLIEGFGEALGIAFQMVDDVIDYEPKGEKPFAQDLREGLVNFVTLELMERYPHLKSTVQKVLGTPFERLDWKESELLDAKKAVRVRAEEKLKHAEESLIAIREKFDVNRDAETAIFQLLKYIKERLL